MLLAYDFPLLSLVLSMTWFFLWVLWIMTVFHVIGDIFRSGDLSGGAKAGWMVLVLFLPVLGVLAYVITRGDRMAEHAIEAHDARDAYARSYIREAAGPVNLADQIAQLSAMRAEGSITDADFEAAKAKVLTA